MASISCYFHLPALLLLVFGAVWFLMTAVTYQVSSVVVQKRQILLTTGLLVRQTFNMPLQKIESIDIILEEQVGHLLYANQTLYAEQSIFHLLNGMYYFDELKSKRNTLSLKQINRQAVLL